MHQAATFSRILVPLDDTPEAESALTCPITLARLHHAELILVRVPPLPMFEYLLIDPWQVEFLMLL